MLPRIYLVLQLMLLSLSSRIVVGADNDSCLTSPTTATPCTSVNTWTDFRTTIMNYASSDPLVFCPFSIRVTDSATTLEISKPIAILCRDSRKCTLDRSSSRGDTILRIRNSTAKVTVQGFVFVGAGTTFSAVHIAFGATQTQTFCDCSFQGNSGSTRGTALRAEVKTSVQLIQCLFQGNSASDMGGVFNRGFMLIEKSIFQNNNGIGGAIAASRESRTELKDNSFVGNKNGNSLFFHITSSINSGGNTASNNDQCNGIYDLSINKCIKFPPVQVVNTAAPVTAPLPMIPPSTPTKSPVTVTSTVPTRKPSTIDQQNAKCEVVNTKNRPCTTVTNWLDFRDIVEGSTGTLIFCPFVITKGNLQPVVYITNSVRIICKEPRQCRLVSTNRHVIVDGNQGVGVYIQGFVFEGATLAGVQFLPNNARSQQLCNCKFMRNRGSTRGVALVIESGSNVTVSNCHFEDNASSDLGASIFNRGRLHLVQSTFVGNMGVGSALGASSGAYTSMIANEFRYNTNGTPILLQGTAYVDLGGNNATGNEACNGVFITQGGARCVQFSDAQVFLTVMPSPSPLSFEFPTALLSRTGLTPRGGSGYFNYDPSDLQFGPGKRINAQRDRYSFANNAWKNIRGNPEEIRWQELSPTHQRSLANKCGWDNGQSPIDLCDNLINAECTEHHQTRSHSGNVTFGDVVTAQILPSKLRLKYYTDRTPEGGPYPPEADFAANWNGYVEVNHIDVKIPSEHTICGKRYPAEYQVFMLHPLRRQTIVMSILMEFDPFDSENEHFQVAIDQWQALFDKTSSKCKQSNQKRKTKNKASRVVIESDSKARQWSHDYPEDPIEFMRRETNNFEDYDADDILENNYTSGNRRYRVLRNLITDTSPYGTGGWDPFHVSLKRSIYHWGYWGSLTEPPCSTFFAYRVVTEPAYISRRQWNQMRNILFNYKNEDCINTSVDYGESVARPTQDIANRPLYKCQRSDYVSDAEKAQIRIDTGNPEWCC